MAGQRPPRPRRHRQPRALGLGGTAPYAAGRQPFGWPRGAVEREPAGFSRYRRLRQPRVRQSRRHLSHPRRLGQIRHHADPGARQGRRRPLPVPDPGGAAARRGVHRARPVAPASHPHRHVRGRGAAVYPRRDRGGRQGHRQAPGWLVRPRLPGDAEPPNLLAAEGIRYVCDWGNDEQPYKMTPKTGELYALGVHASLDDNYIHLHGRRTINEVNRLWREWFDGLYADGATTGRLMVLHLHPWIMGQPWRIRHLDEVLGHICAHPEVWKATGGEIIDWFKAQAG